MEIFDFSEKTTKELEERLDYLFNVAVEKNKERLHPHGLLPQAGEQVADPGVVEAHGLVHRVTRRRVMPLPCSRRFQSGGTSFRRNDPWPA